MSFNIQLAIAALPSGWEHPGPDLDALRDEYPELAFVFDRLEDAEHALDEMVERRRYEELEDSYHDVEKDLNKAARIVMDLSAKPKITSDDALLETINGLYEVLTGSR